jgi:hypothetical protein
VKGGIGTDTSGRTGAEDEAATGAGEGSGTGTD